MKLKISSEWKKYADNRLSPYFELLNMAHLLPEIREKEAVIISLVRSNATGEIGFLGDTRRINVALTRARRKLIVIGDSATIAGNDFYHKLLEYFELHDAYQTVWEYS